MTDKIRNPKYFRKQHHETVVNHKSNDAYNAKFHKLSNQFFQGNLLAKYQTLNLKRKVPPKQKRSCYAEPEICGAPNGNRTRVSALKGPRPDR